jgi:hypothetical protein
VTDTEHRDPRIWLNSGQKNRQHFWWDRGEGCWNCDDAFGIIIP